MRCTFTPAVAPRHGAQTHEADMTTEVTQILKQLADGDENAADALLPHVYEQLRRIARR